MRLFTTRSCVSVESLSRVGLCSRRNFLLGTLSLAACSSRDDALLPLRRAVEFLWSRQADNGGFPSRKYGLLRSGQSLTPFVLDALLEVAEAVVPRDLARIDKAIDFIRSNTNKDGALGLNDSAAPDYPNYATGLAVKAMVRAQRPGWQEAIAPMVQCLRAQQFTEQNGWKRPDAPYGAWGMGGPIHHPPETGHVEISMTRHVLEGLASAGVGPTDPAMTSAVVYLDRCQNQDGGFYFSTVNLETNKAGETNGRPNSYGTTTCDGILAMRAAGIPITDARSRKALDWIRAHHILDGAPGFDMPPYQGWKQGLRFYYGAAVTSAMPGLPVLLPPQKHDGSFANSNILVKEDDPLIATAFAVRVLCHT
jgi:hypothetical protein